MYVLYDVARVLGVNVQEGILSVLFLLASLSALIAAWGLYQEAQSDGAFGGHPLLSAAFARLSVSSGVPDASISAQSIAPSV